MTNFNNLQVGSILHIKYEDDTFNIDTKIEVIKVIGAVPYYGMKYIIKSVAGQEVEVSATELIALGAKRVMKPYLPEWL